MASDKQPGESTSGVDVAESKTDSLGPSFDNSIDELESLITETKVPPRLQPNIPVLNDIVDAAEARKYTESINTLADKNEDLPIVRLSKLVESVDKKLSDELDSLVDILKDTIKDSIIDELKEQLKKEAAHPQSPPAAIDSPDKPIE